MAQNDVLSVIKQRPQELLVAAGIIVILGVMVMPIPTFLLDILISFSITFALIILMVAVFMLSPLEFSVFPSLLFVMTILRLSLNIATTLPGLFKDLENIDFSLFFDAGNVWGVDYSDTIDDSSKVRSSTGLAVDWLTPIGPLSFSLATPLTKSDSDITETFRFDIGTTF